MTQGSAQTEWTAAEHLTQAATLNAFCLHQLLRNQGFTREDHSPRMIQGEFVTVACTTNGYRITFPSTAEPYGMGIVDLPMCTYGTVETVVRGVERQCQAIAEERRQH
jgi:hypothetical protein